MKKKLAGIALAIGTMVAPLGKAEAKTDNVDKPLSDAPAKVQDATQAEKVAMPDWVPTTKEGKFDKKKAQEQAKLLWQNYGKDM